MGRYVSGLDIRLGASHFLYRFLSVSSPLHRLVQKDNYFNWANSPVLEVAPAVPNVNSSVR